MTSTEESITTTPQQAQPEEAAADSATDLSATAEAALDRGREAMEKGREAAERVGDAVERAANTLVTRFRNTAELTEDRGQTTIADEVVEKIAGIAAREVPGVHDLGGEVSRVFASLKERIGIGETNNDEADRGVAVRLQGTTAEIDMKIVIEFGYVVHSVTDAVRTKVISSVENMLGLEVTEVNIRVNDVHVPENGDAAPAA
ncbi:hypothetical protein Rhe02_68740 [Rhizocola hellebori]|uniref:Asp23/Gls24 family envelope stress response protein n=1 Tax=Rhizocola hellebori TaxID=1392758 RepID=A0A8J3QF06_9ACTN|nr:Asp23/Gls24 family envelope stress response protein [Rhizocola hellebori]GIH08807.1 hypothetical protein Rhe02_68740 [Rhizocola hellebori]